MRRIVLVLVALLLLTRSDVAQEQFSNNCSVAIANGGSMGAGDTSVTVASGTCFPASGNFRVIVDNEIILVGARSGTVLSALSRGTEGTTAAVHANGATITHILTAISLRTLEPYSVVNGRLTTESGVPVSPTDRAAQSTIYWTPFNGSQIGLYDGAVWVLYQCAEKTLALSALTTAKNYDVFVYASGLTCVMELSAAWTSDTTRTDAIAQQDGVDVKSSDHTRRLVGTIRASSSSTTEDSVAQRYVTNRYNDVARALVAPVPSYLLTGGQVVWISAYTFRVSAAVYVIQGVQYASPETAVTLAAAHATLDRIDVIALTTSNTVAVIQGTPAAQPSEPDVNPATQLRLSFVLVTAATSAPVGAVSTLVYAENVGSPTEWNWTASGASISVNSTNVPRAGTKDIEGTTVVDTVYAQGQIGAGTYDPNLQNFLVFYLRSKATWTAGRGLQVSLRTANVLQGVAVTITPVSVFGFDSSITTTYQQVAIPITTFAVPTGSTITQVRIADFGGAIGFYVDDVSFQTGVVSPSGGLTQKQADARYVQATATLTANRLIIGAGNLVVSPLGSLGTTTTLLHGNAAGAPSFATVTEADHTFADNTTGNVSTSAHGFMPKATGSTSTFYRSDGTQAAPSGGGGLVLVESHTASASTSLDFTTCFTSTYSVYQMVLDGLTPGTSAHDLLLEISTDGGASWITTGNYQWAHMSSISDTANGANSAANDTKIKLTTANRVYATSGGNTSGHLQLYNMLSATKVFNMAGQITGNPFNTAGVIMGSIAGSYFVANTANAVRFIMDVGTIASGTIRCYGEAQ